MEEIHMKCILCYLSNEYQQSIKKAAHAKSDRFEEVLREYKKLFIDGLSKLTTVNQCENNHSILLNSNMLTYLTDLYDDIVSNKLALVNSMFDEVTNIYIAFIQQNHIAAYTKLKSFICDKCYHSSVDNPHGFCKPLFRVIPKPNEKWNYNIQDENAYFHIPFSKRFLVGNQRYSISGLPMCYLANNLQTALNEVNKSLDQVNIAVYLPKFSNFYMCGIYDTTNIIIENIKVYISESLDNDSKYEYHSDHDFLSRHLDCLLADYILYQILQYPTKDDTKGSFIQEYVLPQLLMEFVQNESSWIAVKYQSTKSIGNTFDIKAFQSNENYCFVVPYEENDDYSLHFKSNFYIALSPNATTVSIDYFKSQCKEYRDICKKNGENDYVMTDYLLYAFKMEELIKEDEKCLELGIISEDVLQMEINLMSLLLQESKTIILAPEKYGVSKYSDYH